MKKHSLFGLALFLALACAPPLMAAEAVVSERGNVAITAPSVASEKLRVVNDKEPIPRSFEEQPPLVPHKTDQYEVNLALNKCLDCHSREQAEEKDATAVSDSHFETRDGRMLETLAARRYFCTQCHVSQADTEPLVENVFQPLAATAR
jgi:cytochrome c-type protein NapB